MNSGDGDFLDEIFMAEQKQYSEAYRKGFGLSVSEIQQDLPERDDELQSAWIHGVQCGAALGSELFSYQGLADEVLTSYEKAGSTTPPPARQHPVQLARALLRLLNESPGALSRPCDQFAKHPAFDTDFALIRNKAKQLISALGIHVVSEAMESLDF